MIYVIGDSHASAFSGHGIQPCYPIMVKRQTLAYAYSFLRYNFSRKHKLEGFKSYRIGASTAHNFSKNINTIHRILKYKNVSDQDTLALSFGEIDIRNHLSRQNNFQVGIVKTIDNYIEGVQSLATYYKCKILILGSIASWSKGYKGPSAGNNIQRNKITEIFNTQLKKQAEINGFYYADFFYEMLDDNFNTKQEFLDNWLESRIHLNPKFAHQYAEKIHLVLNNYK
jgi:hypothetical protein